MENLIQQATALIQEQLNNNQFLSGGAVLMFLGASVALCRHLPGKILQWLRRRFFIEFEIQMRDDAFVWFNDWLAAQKYTRNWSRFLTVRTTRRGRRDNEPPRIILSPAPGRHWLFWRGYFLVVERDREEEKHGGTTGVAGGGLASIARESFKVSILTWRRDIIVDLLEDARNVAHPPDDDRITVYTPYYSEWNGENKCRPRPLESVILREGVMGSLIADVKWFLEAEDWFLGRGIPYRRGYLLYGPPGNGKSSAVIALASTLKLNICIVNLGASNLGDDDLRDLLAKVPPHCIVLVEDIDCVFHERSQTADNEGKVTFSGLLNALDGVVASEGRILFMSTNHIDKLDPALIRAGRADVKMYIQNADTRQGEQLFLRFFPGNVELAQAFGSKVGKGDYCMASLQAHLLKYAQEPHAAVTFLGDTK